MTSSARPCTRSRVRPFALVFIGSRPRRSSRRVAPVRPISQPTGPAPGLARRPLLLAGRPEPDERRRALATEAADVARLAGDARAEASALGAMVEALAGPDHVSARLSSSARMAELARRVDDPTLLLL